MVYLVSADLTDHLQNSEKIRTLFLVQTGNKSIIKEHLKHFPIGKIDTNTMQVLKELPKVSLDDMTVLPNGNVKKLSEMALEAVSTKLEATEEPE